jgi:flavin reductase (DIM6/NTAB) family NADH-FMN oxidoreductase RutF
VIDPERFRAALAHWASGVTVVAVREDDRVLATTVTAFLSVSVDPPLILISLGSGAQVLPFLTVGARFAVSVLAEPQGRAASAFADAYPVGGPAFATSGEPWVESALVRLSCRVERLDPAADHLLVLALVESAQVEPDRRPLIRYARSYRRLEG